jgi:nucleoside 2-deoxyribosyltransferase
MALTAQTPFLARTQPGKIRIYLAGPEVFLPDPIKAGVRKKKLCAQHGFEGIYPIDAQVDLEGLGPRAAALRIGKINEQLLRSCDAVIANMTPFRGPSADLGTAYEMGLARGLGLLVCAYTNDPRPFTERTCEFLAGKFSTSGTRLCDGDSMEIEQFGLADNLMLESSIEESGGCFIKYEAPAAQRFTDLRGFEQCLIAMKRLAKLAEGRTQT